MRLVVLSDTHLGLTFNQQKYQALTQAINDGDQLIINGDLWEGFNITLKEFLNSPWQKLFPLFLEKNAIYIYGNHDPEQEDIQLYQKFCVSSHKDLTIQQAGNTFYLTHGNEIDRTFDMKHPRFPRKLLYIFGTAVERQLIRLLGRRYVQVYQAENTLLKKWKTNHLPPETWLVTGHSHLAELNRSVRYANSGIFEPPKVASYLVIDQGNIELKYIE